MTYIGTCDGVEKSAHTTAHLSSTARQKEKKNYMDYPASRPGVEKTGSHGLFSNEGEPLIQVLRSIAISEVRNISGYMRCLKEVQNEAIRQKRKFYELVCHGIFFFDLQFAIIKIVCYYKNLKMDDILDRIS